MVLRGGKWYKFVDDDIILLRVNRIKSDKISLLDLNTNEYISMTENDLKKDYIHLRPDGILNILQVQAGRIKDIIITLKDHNTKNNLPDVVCRQNVADFFTNNLTEGNVQYVGVSVSQETCPADIDYKILTACDKIDTNDTVVVYKDDTLDQILSYINLTKYNNTLKSIKEMAYPHIKGFCTNIKELMISNNFMYDFYSLFGIYKVPFALELSTDDIIHISSPDQIVYIQNILKKQIIATYVLPYSLYIKLEDLNREYIKVIDAFDDMYIVAYDLNPYQDPSVVYTDLDQYRYFETEMYKK